jgi:hypothetical protein
MIYVLTAMASLGALHMVSNSPLFQGKFRRSIVGSAAGFTSYGWLESYGTVTALWSSSIEGDLGFYGYIYALGLASLVGVWGWNLFASRRYLVV